VGTSASTLNAVLGAWIAIKCDGVLVFTSDAAVFRLSQEFIISNHKLTLDASGLSHGVALLPASNARHFSLSGSSANLTAKAVTFQNARVYSPTITVTGGSIVFGTQSHGWFEGCTWFNNTIATDASWALGGAIAGSPGQLTFQSCTWRLNIARGRHGNGGALHLSTPDATSRLVIQNSRFIGNVAQVRTIGSTDTIHAMKAVC
jgi:hypothetical protein